MKLSAGMNFVASFSMCNVTVNEAHQFLEIIAAEGVEGGVIVACPQATQGEVDKLVPEADFVKEGVPLLTPCYLMAQFPGNTKYPASYTIGMCMYRIDNQDANPLSTLSVRRPAPSPIPVVGE